MKKKRFVSFGLVLVLSMSLLCGVAGAMEVESSPTEYYETVDEGITETSLKCAPYVTVTYLEAEPENVDDAADGGVIVRDADDIMPTSANVSKTINLSVGESYSYGAFYMGSNTLFDPNAGDMIDITVSGITSGKYKVIVQGVVYSGFMGLDEEVVYSYESNEYSTAKTFSVPGEGGVAYTVTVVNTSAQNLKATVSIVTYPS